jgi:hypothetical protein
MWHCIIWQILLTQWHSITFQKTNLQHYHCENLQFCPKYCSYENTDTVRFYIIITRGFQMYLMMNELSLFYAFTTYFSKIHFICNKSYICSNFMTGLSCLLPAVWFSIDISNINTYAQLVKIWLLYFWVQNLKINEVLLCVHVRVHVCGWCQWQTTKADSSVCTKETVLN